MPSSPDFTVKKLTQLGSLTDQVCEALIQHIQHIQHIQNIRSDGVLKAVRLPSQAEIASRFGVSRTVVREAVSRLKSEGLVESRQGSGVFVRENNTDLPFRIDPTSVDSAHSLLQIVELRKVLEGEIAALAAERRTPSELQTIAEALAKIAADEAEGGDGVDADIAFHRSIAAATGNPHFLGLIQFLFNFLRSATQATRAIEATQAALSHQVKEEHRAILKAITEQDVDSARVAARRHMDCAAKRLTSIKQD